MAKREYSDYQKKVIKRYYDNKEDISMQKLGEIVSEIYLATNPTNLKRLWASAEAALTNMGVKKDRVEAIVKKRDVEALAKIAEELF